LLFVTVYWAAVQQTDKTLASTHGEPSIEVAELSRYARPTWGGRNKIL
jgi:hypothetical protein